MGGEGREGGGSPCPSNDGGASLGFPSREASLDMWYSEKGGSVIGEQGSILFDWIAREGIV